MKRSDQDRLLREVLAHDALDHLRGAALDQMLVTARRRRQRRALRSSAAAVVVLTAAVFLASRSTNDPQPGVVPAAATAVPTPRVTTINDEQLLAIFADRAVALVGEPGEQTLLFLDATPDRATRVSVR